jgi:hypothetical protein
MSSSNGEKARENSSLTVRKQRTVGPGKDLAGREDADDHHIGLYGVQETELLHNEEQADNNRQGGAEEVLPFLPSSYGS